MTQKQKDLLIKDLCGRLSYGVKVEYNGGKYKIANVSICNETITIYGERGYPMEVEIKKVKPYLFPISSMIEDLKNELYTNLIELELKAINDEIEHSVVTAFEIDFYHKHHIDYRGLIPMGLANDATELNIY